MEEMLERAATALAYIVDFKRENDGVSPSHREISQAVGYAGGNPSNVARLLDILEARGLIVRYGPKASTRCIMVVGGEWVF